MGSGRGSWVNALRPLRRARVYPDLLGLLQRVRAFFLRVSFVRGGISVAAGRTSGGNFAARERHCVGARHLLCRNHSFELEIRLHHPHRILNPDYSMSDCGSVALGEGSLNLARESDRRMAHSIREKFLGAPFFRAGGTLDPLKILGCSPLRVMKAWIRSLRGELSALALLFPFIRPKNQKR